MKSIQQFIKVYGWGICLLCSIWTQPALGQDAAPPTGTEIAQLENSDSETQGGSGGLGSLFADTLRDVMKDGNVFVPNGKTADAVKSATPGEPEKFTLNFNKAPIDQVLKFLSDMTKKVVLRSDEVQGEVVIMSPNQVTKDEALKIIDAAFMLKGFTFIESNEIIIVLPISVAKQKGVDVKIGSGDQVGSRVQSQIIEVKYANPSTLRNALTPLLSENSNIIADDRSRTLVITDTASNIQRLQTIIQQLDKPTIEEGVEIRIFKLRYINAREMSRDLDAILENIVNSSPSARKDERGRPLDANVEVMADRTTNSLIITAPKEALDVISKFIVNLDTSSSERIQEKTFTLKNGVATEIAQSLSELTNSRQTETYRPVVVADSRSNTIIISAYPEDIDSFGKLIDILDNKLSYNQVTRVFPLENADAIVISEMVKMLLNPDSASSNRYSYYGWGRSQNQDQIRIVEDQRLNALIVTAKPSEIPMVEELIKQLDQPLPVSKEEPRIYPIKNARANDVANIINQIFTNTQQNNFFSYYGEQPQQLTGLTGKVKVISDSTTNSLIVIAGTPRAFEVVEKLILQLDRISPEMGNTRVFSLQNADASYLQTKLDALFQEGTNQNRGNQGFFWYLNNSTTQQEEISNLIGNVRIESETRTNSLLVTTNSQYFPYIESLIKELDKEIEQILVEIMIVEVNDIRDNELGIDWDGSIPISVVGELNAPLSDISTERASILTQTSYDAVLNFLATSSKANVVARPNILTGDNQRAYVEAVNRVPVPSDISVSLGTTQQGFVYEEVGLKLTVQPHINDATTVTVVVNLETGQILDNFFLQVDEVRIPAFSRRRVETELTVNDMETAVLSGIIDTSFSDLERGIPGLKDIPLIGGIFKTKGKKKNNTELMTFITPYLLSGAEDRNDVYMRQRKRLENFKNLTQHFKDINVKFGTNPINKR